MEAVLVFTALSLKVKMLFMKRNENYFNFKNVVIAKVRLPAAPAETAFLYENQKTANPLLYEQSRNNTVFESTVSGNWKPFQCVESGSTLATGTSREKAGPISRIRRCHVDFALVFLHAGCTLASVHLVLNRAFRRRQRHSVQLAMEAGQRHPEPLFVHLVQ